MKSSVYLVQLDCAWENKRANFDRVTELLSETAVDAGSLVVLPEMLSTGFSKDTDVTNQGAEREDDAFLRALAMDKGCFVLGGVISTGASGRCQNQAVIYSPSGDEVCRYVKIQPFNLGGEGAVHEAGSAVMTFEWGGLKVAPLICYDLRFPELAREAVLKQGAEVLIYIASWPSRRYQHWLTLLQARAIENLAYVIGVNRCGNDPELSYSGRSVVVDPHGVIIADAGAQEQVVHTLIQNQIVSEWRRDFPALADAR